jgi:hypothetical protein
MNSFHEYIFFLMIKFFPKGLEDNKKENIPDGGRDEGFGMGSASKSSYA